MDLDQEVSLVSETGTATLPLINVLRIAFVRMQPLAQQYLEETKDTSVTGFMEYMKEKLGAKGKNILL